MSQQFPAHKLQRYLDRIRAINPALQAIPFCTNNWNIHPLDQPLQVLLNAIPLLANGSITRQLVEEAGRLANQNQISWDSFFLAVMIWGYGTAGYGPWRTQQMFQTQDFTNIYSNIRNQIQNNNIELAYDSERIDRCGPPFFTKLFYFLGRVFNSNPLPVILDSRVAVNLLKCNGDGFNGSVYFSQNAAARRRRGYLDYVLDLNQWGQDNQFRADQIEMFLFCPPLDF